MTANTPTENLALRIEQFVKLRDMKKIIQDRHKEELAPINDAMEGLQQVLAQVMNTQNVDSVATSAGTAYLSTKDSASAADMDAFWAYCTTQGAFDMLDRKPNVTAVREYVEANGVPPPGVNYTKIVTVGVRRK
jgi:hypothetical protein